jgi:hypothetical protein
MPTLASTMAGRIPRECNGWSALGNVSALTYISDQSPGLARRWLRFLSNGLYRAGGRSRPLMRLFAMVSLMPHRRRRVFVDTPKGRRSAGFTVPEAADAADVSMALRRLGWSPYALRLDPEQHAWIALVMDWQRAA